MARAKARCYKCIDCQTKTIIYLTSGDPICEGCFEKKIRKTKSNRRLNKDEPIRMSAADSPPITEKTIDLPIVAREVSKKWIRFNVDGEHFATIRTNLNARNGCHLNAVVEMAENPNTAEQVCDEEGFILLDDDPVYFRVVINYLRYRELIVDDFVSLQGVLRAAETYGLVEMAQLVRQKMSEQVSMENFIDLYCHEESL